MDLTFYSVKLRLFLRGYKSIAYWQARVWTYKGCYSVR